jgi:hypothetical protein
VLDPALQPTTRWGRFRARVEILRYHVSVRISPYFESFIFIEKLLLVLAMSVIKGGNAQAGCQAAVYFVFTLLVISVWPFRQLDVRIPLRFWLPGLPARWQPDPAAPSTEYRVGWHKSRFGYAWKNYFTIVDALNFTALSANLVPFVNIITALGASGTGASVLAVFLIGLNLMKSARKRQAMRLLHACADARLPSPRAVLLTLAAWIACVVTWQTQSHELIKLDRARSAQRSLLKAKQAAGEDDAPAAPPPSGNVLSFVASPLQASPASRHSSIVEPPLASDVELVYGDVNADSAPGEDGVQPAVAACAGAARKSRGASLMSTAEPSYAASPASDDIVANADAWDVDAVVGAETPGAGIDVSADKVDYTLDVDGNELKEDDIGCRESCWAMFRSAAGFARGELLTERTFEEICASISIAVRMRTPNSHSMPADVDCSLRW